MSVVQGERRDLCHLKGWELWWRCMHDSTKERRARSSSAKPAAVFALSWSARRIPCHFAISTPHRRSATAPTSPPSAPPDPADTVCPTDGTSRLQVPRQFLQPALYPKRLDVRHRLAVNPGSAAVATHHLPVNCEHVVGSTKSVGQSGSARVKVLPLKLACRTAFYSCGGAGVGVNTQAELKISHAFWCSPFSTSRELSRRTTGRSAPCALACCRARVPWVRQVPKATLGCNGVYRRIRRAGNWRNRAFRCWWTPSGRS